MKLTATQGKMYEDLLLAIKAAVEKQIRTSITETALYNVSAILITAGL